jgi:hypothetical protein
MLLLVGPGVPLSSDPYMVHIPLNPHNSERSPQGGKLLDASGDWKNIEEAATTLGSQVVGTFHSHVIGEPIPGATDIRGAFDGHAMIILDAWTGETPCVADQGRAGLSAPTPLPRGAG